MFMLAIRGMACVLEAIRSMACVSVSDTRHDLGLW